MYIKQAFKGNNEFWRYFITFLIVIAAQFIGSLPLTIVIALKATSINAIKDFRDTLNPESLGLSQNIGLILLLLPWVLTFFALIISMKYIHGHSLAHVFTFKSRFRWKNFFWATLIWGLLLLISEVVYYQIEPENYSFNFNAQNFFPLLIIALFMIPLQAGAEELYFRGNLMQGFALLSRSRIVALLVTSVFFGMMHLGNPEVKQFGIASSMAYYIGFGLFMGLLVLLDGGLEMPLAIHAINNIYGAVFVGYSGSVLQTPALFKVTKYNPIAMLVVFVIAAGLYIVLSKKIFSWQKFSDILTPVRKESIGQEEL
jgi:uncharacterized protein